MRGMSDSAIKRLNIKQAVVDEAAAKRNLLPTEPGWDLIAHSAGSMTKHIMTRLRNAWEPAEQHEVAARKAGHGVRPLPFWGPIERIAYRALATEVVKPFAPLDRTPEAYVEFVKAPVRFAAKSSRSRRSGRGTQIFGFSLFNSTVKYVLKSDIASFYQYVDHSILAEELLAHDADYDAVDSLIELLSATQGRTFGLPQLLDASDWLSDIYIARMERELRRAGLQVWRYNDDFRIACDSYFDSLIAIERLDAAARNLGLSLSENKTATYSLQKYLMSTFDLEVTEPEELIDVEDVETVVGDYTDTFQDDSGSSARSLIERVRVGAETNATSGVSTSSPSPVGAAGLEDARSIDLKTANFDEVRLIRRALGALISHHDGTVISSMPNIATYIPSLTPTVCRYLISAATIDPVRVADVVREIVSSVSLNHWQQLWWLDVVRQTDSLSSAAPSTTDALLDWCKNALRSSPDEAVKAAATLTLAAADAIPLAGVIETLDRTPQALLAYYLAACNAIGVTKNDAATKETLKAVAETSTLHKVGVSL